MTPFDHEILDFILRYEGGFSNHPNDSGGATNYGITQQTLSDYRKKPVSAQQVKELTLDEAKAIYFENYFKPFDYLNGYAKLLAVDAAVNCGVGKATQWIQEVAGVKADGEAGPQTREAVKAKTAHPIDQGDFARQLLAKRYQHYANITVAHPKNLVFLKGWIARANALLTYASVSV